MKSGVNSGGLNIWIVSCRLIWRDDLLENYLFFFFLSGLFFSWISIYLNGYLHRHGRRACMEYERIERQELCCFGCQCLTVLIEEIMWNQLSAVLLRHNWVLEAVFSYSDKLLRGFYFPWSFASPPLYFY